MQAVILSMMVGIPLGAAPEAPVSPPPLMAPARLTLPQRSDHWPEDPLQRIAYRAVVLNEWPDTPKWKMDAYKLILDRKISVQGVARRTTYCYSCAGRTCADGSPVREGICAASPGLPMHALVWLESDGLLKVCDRGGAVHVDGGCRGRGENANFDVWVPDCEGGCWTGPGTKARVPWAMVAVW